MKKLLILTAFTFLLPLFSNSQVIEWQNTIGGSGDDKLHSMVPTTDGGYILGGSSNSNISGDKTENSYFSSDFWIVKTDAEGNIQWQNTIGGTGDDILHSIIQTVDGGYVFGGQSTSDISGDKTEDSNGGYDYWIVKTDALGNIQWQNTIGGNDNDYLKTIYQTSDGGYILGGHSLSNISGDKTENCNGIHDFWLVKTNSGGVIQWQNTIGGNAYDYLQCVEQTADEGYILGGYSRSNISGDKTENTHGAHDYWIVKTDSVGVMQWQNTIGGSGDEYLHSLVQTTDGGFLFGGWSKSNISGDKTENSNGVNDYWLVKTDSTGNIQWQNTIGGNGYDELYSIDQTNDGGYILGGFSASDISGDKTESRSGTFWDLWVVKTDSTGFVQWQNNIGGSDSENLNAIHQTSDGSYIFGGTSISNISGDKTENSNGSNDIWIIKITSNFNLISGKLFIDINSNGSADAGEQPVIHQQITEINTSEFNFTQQYGNYYVYLIDSGNFSVSPAPLNYYLLTPTSHSALFSGIQQTDSLNDFAFQPAGVFNDLCVKITPLGPFRSGFNQSYLINYENVGTTILTPTVIFYPDNDVTFVSANPIASSVTIDSLLWNFGPMAPFQSGQILITVNVNTGVPIGTLINSGAHIEPLVGDANTICNQSYWEVHTIGSFDPNDILVNEDTLLSTQFPNPPFLEYIIRYQNTGNDTAFTVKILNPIDTNLLDLSSFEFITASHPVNLSWIPWERNMQFMFTNILLPDSNVNEPASHGFVRYRIKPKSNLVAGNTITNNAAIYFDFNDPVLTNTAYTQIVLPTSLPEITASDNLLLYPNPANTTLTIETILPTAGSKLTIADVAGRTLLAKTLDINSTKHQIDIASFSAGIYFVQVEAGEGISRGRFVKE